MSFWTSWKTVWSGLILAFLLVLGAGCQSQDDEVSDHVTASRGHPVTIARSASAGALDMEEKIPDATTSPAPGSELDLSASPAGDKSAQQDTEPEAKEESTLIPRKTLFGNPKKATAQLSPDGRKLAFLAPLDGVLNIWVAPADNPTAAKPITKDTHRGISSYFWAYSCQHILYPQDKDGDEDFHIYSVNVDNQETMDLTPIDQIAGRVQEVSEKFPDEILVAINDRGNRQLHDLYRVNIVSGERTLVEENEGFLGYLTDDNYNVRFAYTITPTAGQVLLKRDEHGEWQKYIEIDSVDAMTTSPVGFDKSGQKLYFLDSRGRDTAALKVIDLPSGAEEILAEDDKADIGGVILHPTEKKVQAVTITYARRAWKILDEAIADDLEYLATVTDGELRIGSRTLDDQKWIVGYLLSDGPVQYYLYDRAAKQAEFLFTNDPDLEDLPLAPMHDVVIKSRDGLNLISYLTLPPGSDPQSTGRPSGPLPMVLLVHGGPWSRDSWGYNPLHQLLANRGYAVLSVNFRGSTGFGKSFINAGDKQWAAKMHDDLIDAVNWAIEEKIAKQDKIAIMGGSYGGYATLVGLTFTPDVFACGVDIVGPSNLVTLLQNPPPYWMPMMPIMKTRVGDFSTDEGKKFLESRSPLFFVDKIQRPLLIGQGQHDPRVKQAESDQIAEAMESKSIPVTYALFTDEGHGFKRPPNRIAFFAVAEAFLAEHLGGRYEEIGDAFSGAKMEVLSGSDGVPGLSAALGEQ
jgi:dipeptidyl aminopeptidase/acylaminoacyl peptidase